MLLGTVEGHATSTVKHRSLRGVKLVLVQPVRSLTVQPVLAVDRIGVAPGDLVMISSDGKGTREFVGDPNSPARWTVVGIVDNAKDFVRA
jgi:ethanolamine utilization protein EutN